MNTQKSLIEENLLLFLKIRKLDDNIKNKIYNDFRNQHPNTFNKYNYSSNHKTPLEYVKYRKLKK